MLLSLEFVVNQNINNSYSRKKKLNTISKQ